MSFSSRQYGEFWDRREREVAKVFGGDSLTGSTGGFRLEYSRWSGPTWKLSFNVEDYEFYLSVLSPAAKQVIREYLEGLLQARSGSATENNPWCQIVPKSQADLDAFELMWYDIWENLYETLLDGCKSSEERFESHPLMSYKPQPPKVPVYEIGSTDDQGVENWVQVGMRREGGEPLPL